MPIETKDKVGNRIKKNKIRKRNRSYIIIGTIIITTFGIYKIDNLCKQQTVAGAIIEEKNGLSNSEDLYNNRHNYYNNFWNL